MAWFICQASSGLTRAYHSGGAALIWAVDLDDARSKLEAHRVLKDDLEDAEDDLMDDLEVIKWEVLSAVNGDVLIFPNAGCC